MRGFGLNSLQSVSLAFCRITLRFVLIFYHSQPHTRARTFLLYSYPGLQIHEINVVWFLLRPWPSGHLPFLRRRCSQMMLSGHVLGYYVWLPRGHLQVFVSAPDL
jgi:hypothetical protein